MRTIIIRVSFAALASLFAVVAACSSSGGADEPVAPEPTPTTSTDAADATAPSPDGGRDTTTTTEAGATCTVPAQVPAIGTACAQTCCPELDACLAETGCKSLLTCIGACVTDAGVKKDAGASSPALTACESSCATANPSGMATGAPLLTCVKGCAK